MNSDAHQAYQQQNRHECVHPTTGHNVLVQSPALTTPKSNGTHNYPANGQTLLTGPHEVSVPFQMSICIHLFFNQWGIQSIINKLIDEHVTLLLQNACTT